MGAGFGASGTGILRLIDSCGGNGFGVGGVYAGSADALAGSGGGTGFAAGGGSGFVFGAGIATAESAGAAGVGTGVETALTTFEASSMPLPKTGAKSCGTSICFCAARRGNAFTFGKISCNGRLTMVASISASGVKNIPGAIFTTSEKGTFTAPVPNCLTASALETQIFSPPVNCLSTRFFKLSGIVAITFLRMISMSSGPAAIFFAGEGAEAATSEEGCSV